MRKKAFPLATILALTLFASCKKDSILLKECAGNYLCNGYKFYSYMYPIPSISDTLSDNIATFTSSGNSLLFQDVTLVQCNSSNDMPIFCSQTPYPTYDSIYFFAHGDSVIIYSHYQAHSSSSTETRLTGHKIH